MMTTTPNIDPHELAKFSKLAARWWDKDSDFKTLHDLNPLRLEYIEQRTGGLAGKKVLDVGCGGGILSESMAQRQALVTGIDMSEAALNVAKLHLYESELQVNYQHTTVEQLAATHPAYFDVVTCMEMLEHVPHPASIVKACHDAVKPGGQVFFSTLNRNPKSYLLAIIGAEYLLRLLPKGTHDYAKFIQPAELAQWTRAVGLEVKAITGVSYHPWFKQFSLVREVSVNYLMYTQRHELNLTTFNQLSNLEPNLNEW